MARHHGHHHWHHGKKGTPGLPLHSRSLAHFPPSAALPGVREVAGAMRAVAEGCYHARVGCTPGNGLAELCRSFNEMAERLEREMTERRLAEERLAAREREKDLLLREIHHRVKNNLQVVSGLLEMQAASISDPAARQLCRESQSRLRAMALIHEGLYRHRDLATVKMDRYVHHLAAQLLASFGRSDGSLTVNAEVDGTLSLPVDAVTPLGLIINELLSNALKHAFPGGRRGTVTVRLSRHPAGSLVLEVEDDGAGMPTDPSPFGQESPSMGMRLVSMLAEQMKGTLTTASENGTRFTLVIPR